MSTIQRYMPSWPLPSYIFIPGVNAHPKKAGGHMEGLGDPVAKPIDLQHPEASEFLRFSLDLLNHGYYWESHVYFEALWNAHGRVGSVADFLKGMIKLGAAGVKLNIGQPQNSVDHFERARELFQSVKKTESANFLGFDLDLLIQNLDQVLSGDLKMFQVNPDWK